MKVKDTVDRLNTRYNTTDFTQITMLNDTITMAIRKLHSGWQIVFYHDNVYEDVSAICHSSSHGNEDGLWEVIPGKDGSVDGYLTFEQVISHVKEMLK